MELDKQPGGLGAVNAGESIHSPVVLGRALLEWDVVVQSDYGNHTSDDSGEVPGMGMVKNA